MYETEESSDDQEPEPIIDNDEVDIGGQTAWGDTYLDLDNEDDLGGYDMPEISCTT